ILLVSYHFFFFFLLIIPRLPTSTLFPYTTLFRSVPEIGTRSHLGLQTALLTSKFGISSSEVLEAFRRGLQNPELIHVCGIHIHRSEEHTSELQSRGHLVCRLLLEKKKKKKKNIISKKYNEIQKKRKKKSRNKNN